jgi:Xaa-Pro aminopeptidase
MSAARVDRLRGLLEEPLLVTNGVNVRYLVGFESSNVALLVEPDRVRLFTDFRYVEAARTVDGVELVETKRAVVKDLAGQLEGRVAFEPAAVTYADYETLAAGDAELVPRAGLVERLRAVKDETELDTIRRASAATNAAFEAFAEERFIGRKERDLAWRLEELFREHGGEGLAFETIVAGGPHAALPHHRAGDREIEPGDTIVVDAGAVVGGYASDCTRTFAAGPLDAELREAYEVCLTAQRAALEAIRPGVTGVDADAAARTPIQQAGHGERFGHGLGHGVGLDVHEAPRLGRESEDTLAAGNVVTVEPGIYLPGRGGIRIEDLVIVTEDGVEVLTPVTKDLVTVG